MDSIVCAQKVINSYNEQKNIVAIICMALKLDISKTHDRVEWHAFPTRCYASVGFSIR